MLPLSDASSDATLSFLLHWLVPVSLCMLGREVADKFPLHWGIATALPKVLTPKINDIDSDGVACLSCSCPNAAWHETLHVHTEVDTTRPTLRKTALGDSSVSAEIPTGLEGVRTKLSLNWQPDITGQAVFLSTFLKQFVCFVLFFKFPT